MNNWTFNGTVGSVEKLEITQKGTPLFKFSVALYAGKNQAGEKLTEWVKVVTFKDLAERISARIDKGSQVVVIGSVKLNQYTNKEGIHKANLECLAHDVVFFFGAKEQQQQPTQPASDDVYIPGESEMI
jgi:single-strand DNA-binding protein